MNTKGYEFILRNTSRCVNVCSFDADKMKFRLTDKQMAGGNGFGLSTEDVSYTITVRDRHMVGVFQ